MTEEIPFGPYVHVITDEEAQRVWKKWFRNHWLPQCINGLERIGVPDWIDESGSDDDETYPPHLNEELESDQSDE